MKRITSCKSCQINDELIGRVGSHKLEDINLFCPICKFVGKNIIHDEEELVGASHECRNCHRYILYSDGDGKIYKDEIYFPDDYYLIRDLDDHTANLYKISGRDHSYSSVKEILSFDHIIMFDDADELFRRLKNLIIFS